MNGNKILISIAALLIFLGANSIAFAEELRPIELLSPQIEEGKSLTQALKKRQSAREFSEKELPLEIISDLLWAASGVNRPDSGKRTAPTAKNSQEIDIYVAMKKGLYLYNAGKHILDPVMAKDIREFTGLQSFTQTAPLNLIYVADFSKIDGNDEDKVSSSAIDTGFIS